MSLYITQAQPNPPGKDTCSFGQASQYQLNSEWVEVEALASVQLRGYSIKHDTFSSFCARTGSEDVVAFGAGQLAKGQRLRIHSGSGSDAWEGDTFHLFLGRSWFIWNNRCGDRATVFAGTNVVDTAGYRPNPPEGVLTRVTGTDRLAPSMRYGYR